MKTFFASESLAFVPHREFPISSDTKSTASIPKQLAMKSSMSRELKSYSHATDGSGSSIELGGDRLLSVTSLRVSSGLEHPCFTFAVARAWSLLLWGFKQPDSSQGSVSEIICGDNLLVLWHVCSPIYVIWYICWLSSILWTCFVALQSWSCLCVHR